MRSNKLYTVNKWNKPAFMVDRTHQNIFDGLNLTPNQMQRLKMQNMSTNPGGVASSLGVSMTPTLSTSGLGLSSLGNAGGTGSLAATNPTEFFGLGAGEAAKGAGKGLLSGIGSSLGSMGLGMVGGIANQALSSLIGGDLHSGAGDAIGSIGNTIGGMVSNIPGVGTLAGTAVQAITGAIGGLTNRMFGSKLNEENINAVEGNINKIFESGNAVGNAQTNEDLLSNAGDMQMGFDFSNNFIGDDGWFSSDAADKAEELRRRQEQARAFSRHALTTGAQNADANLDYDVMSNFAAYGGKLFADGGLQSAFMDEFGSDPIGAAMRYKQGLERQEAEKEEAAMNAAREAEYLANQQRLANLETQYQGLQALMAAMPTTNVGSYSEEFSESSSPSRATSKANGNKTWDYIEDQLKKSGKFNDIQIKGIKYNLQRESSINPDIEGDGGAAFGLAQWHGSRQPKDRSLEGQTKHLIETLSNFDGKEHWIGRENYEGFLNARTPEEAHYYIAKGYERPHKDIVAKVKRYSDMSLRNLNAFGGELGTNGADFTDGMIYIDEGGSHESNPLDGVPMGVDAEGIPNLVEEGETVYNDYVFSDRMKVPTFMYKELGLGGVMKKKGKGMSFADASKKLSQESEQRPNDPISKAGLDAALSRLAEVQETERMKQNAEEYMGLAEYALGGQLGHQYDKGGAKKWLKKNYPKTSPRALESLASALSNYIDKNPSSFYKTTGLSGGMSNEIDYGLAYNRLNNSGEEGFNRWVENGLDRRAAFALTHPMPNKPKNQDLMHDYNEKLSARNKDWARLVRDAGKKTTTSKQTSSIPQETVAPQSTTYNPDKYTAELNRRRAERAAAKQAQTVAAGTIEERSQDVAPKVTATSTPTATEASTETKSRRKAVLGKDSNRPGEWESIGGEENTPEQIARMEAARREGMPALGPGISLTEVAERTTPTENAGLPVEATIPQQGIMVTTPQKNNQDPYPTWMRYAPTVGNGLMAMTDALGITNKPDYTYADKIEGYARQAGNAPHVSYKPNGNYLRYDPMDIWFEQNRMDANARATDRAIMNNAAPIGTKMAGLLASGYNNQIANGQLYRSALEYNDAKRKDVAGFNRTTDMFNSQMGLEAAMANARYNQAAKQMGLSGLAQAAGMRDAIDQRVGAARSANLTNFLTSLGNIGRENFAMNQINDDAAYNFGVRANGTTPFKRSGACGGKIKRRK